MKQEANWLEKAAIRSVLFMEQISGRKPTLERPFLEKLHNSSDMRVAVGIMVVGTGLLLLSWDSALTEIRSRFTPTTSSAPLIMATLEPLTLPNWAKDVSIQAKVDQARKDPNLKILSAGPSNLDSYKNIFFVQTSPDFIIAYNKSSVDGIISGLKQDLNLDILTPIGFNFLDQRHPSVVSIQSSMSFYLDEWVRDLKSSNAENLRSVFEAKLSANMTTGIEFYAKYEPAEAIKIFTPDHPMQTAYNTRFSFYEQQFLEGKPRVIRVLAINPNLLGHLR